MRTGRGLLPTRAEAVPAFAAAALFALAFPPFPLVAPAFLCLVPLAVAVARFADEGGHAWQAARTGFWFGILGYGANLYWIAVALSLFTKLAILGYVASLVWLAPFLAATVAALFMARRATRWPFALLLPLVWTASELVLNYLADLAFPWLPLGLSLAHLPVLAQLAELSGVRGASFWIAAIAGLLADAYLLRLERRRALARLAGVAALALLAWGYGLWRMRTIALRPVAPVSIVQPDIPQDEKWQQGNQERIVGITAGLTREVLRRDEQRLVVWPEVALPGYIYANAQWRDTLAALAAAEPTPILFGVLDVRFRSAEDYDYFNAAMLSDSTGAVDDSSAYHKGYLVPIVERVPFIDPRWLAGLKYFGGFGRGENPTPMATPIGRVGVLICYESVFPQLSRRYRREGAAVLVNITNDAWFGRSLAPYQHHAHLVLRAIENRVGVVRSANTGISGYIDPLGRIRAETPLFVQRTGTYLAETTDVVTPYVRFGDWLGPLSLLATLALVVVDRRRERRRAPGIADEVTDEATA